ncbi:hypothetical protein QBC43DRAFT_18121 [Cladorrhinum sp. PSN259]|nr:hypothetical protein QBC43DRAFT_18121 [Cladorrhinum sp. PSN259]
MSVPDGGGNDRRNAGDGSRRLRRSSQWLFVKWNKKQMSSQSSANYEMESLGEDHEQPQERDSHEDPTNTLQEDENKITESGESKATEMRSSGEDHEQPQERDSHEDPTNALQEDENKTTESGESKATENDSPNEAEEPFMPSTIETPEQFIKWFLFEVQADNWAHHEDRITIKCEESMKHFLDVGGLPKVLGVRQCQRYVDVPVINEQIAYELWKKLASRSEPLTTEGAGNEEADEEPKDPEAFNFEQGNKLIDIKNVQLKRKETEQKEEQKRLEDLEKAEKKKKSVLIADIKGKAVAEEPLVWKKPDASSSSKSRSHPGMDSATEPETPKSKTKRVLQWINDRLASHGEQMAAGQGSCAIPPRDRSDPPPGKPRLRKLQSQQAASQGQPRAPRPPPARSSNPPTITPARPSKPPTITPASSSKPPTITPARSSNPPTITPALSAPQEVPKQVTTHADDTLQHQPIIGSTSTQASVTPGRL